MFIDRNVQHYTAEFESDSKEWPAYFKHFPQKLSSECKEPQFFKGRSFDLTIFEIRCQMSAQNIKTILEEYLPKAKYSQEGYNPTDVKGEEHYLIQRFRNKSNNGFAPLPSHFKVIVLYIDQTADREWQESYSSGIAVSTEWNKVIYWATYP